MRAVWMQKNVHFPRASDQKTRAAENTKKKWHPDFQDMGFFFLAQGSFLAHHEKRRVLSRRGLSAARSQPNEKRPQRKDYGRF